MSKFQVTFLHMQCENSAGKSLVLLLSEIYGRLSEKCNFLPTQFLTDASAEYRLFLLFRWRSKNSGLQWRLSDITSLASRIHTELRTGGSSCWLTSYDWPAQQPQQQRQHRRRYFALQNIAACVLRSSCVACSAGKPAMNNRRWCWWVAPNVGLVTAADE